VTFVQRFGSALNLNVPGDRLSVGARGFWHRPRRPRYLAGIVMEKADHRSDTFERLRALRNSARLGQMIQIFA
jgi:hypothetical protein